MSQLSLNQQLLFWLGILTITNLVAKFSIKLKQPIVFSQITLGAIIGTLAYYKKLHLANIVYDPSINFLAELGIIFLLFEIGLESSPSAILRSSKHAIIVALTGVIIPFLCGYYLVSYLLLPSPNIGFKIFCGSVLAVTSTGISLSTFKELGILKQQECQIVLTASVIDDIIGLSLLSITTSLIITQTINWSNIGFSILVTLGFIAISLALGIKILPYISKPLTNKFPQDEVISLFLIALCLLASFFSSLIGLSSIIGAFLAGVVLDNKTFWNTDNINHTANYNSNPANQYPTNRHINKHYLIKLIAPFTNFLSPMFFIYVGIQINLGYFLHLKVLVLALIVALIAIISKALCAILLPRNLNRLIIGIGMIPRGEIGLIFATTALNLKLINHETFSIILLVVIISTIITPILLEYLINKPQ